MKASLIERGFCFGENGLTAIEAPSLRPTYWREGVVALLDQTRLPEEEVWLELGDYRDVVEAIREMRIRGAPAIGVAGAYAVAMAASEVSAHAQDDFIGELEAAAINIEEARPTGANLAWAVSRMMAVARNADRPQSAVEALIAEAARIQDEDEQANRAIGGFGAELIRQGSGVLTHCNAGALATGGYGTALGIIKTAWAGGKIEQVYATETRPLFQGSRLTTWELQRESISVTVLPDSAAGQLMRRGRVQAVIVGADRIAANGDVANKICTYSLAVLAKEHRLPFYVAAPTSTIDMSLPSGESIPIEERKPTEVTHAGTTRVVPERTDVLNFAFDVTPHKYVAAIVTEAGVARPPYDRQLAGAVEASRG